MCVFDVPVAHAGEWEIVPLPEPPSYGTPAYQTWLTEEFIPRFPGQFDVKENGFDDGNTHPTSDTPHELRNGMVRSLGGNNGTGSSSAFQGRGWNSAVSQGGQGSVLFDDSFKVILRWHANQIYPNNPYQGQDDPNDPPNLSIPVYLKVEVNASASAADNANNTVDAKSHAHEHVKLSIVSEGEEHDTQEVKAAANDNGTWSNQSKTLYVKLSPKSSPSQPLTVFSLYGEGKLDSNRQSPIYYGSQSAMRWNNGSAGVTFGFTGNLTNYFLSISSGLEDSYRKVTTYDQLPKVIRYLGGNNQWAVDETQIGWGTLDGSGPGPWAVKIKRPANGSMTVESAADWRGSQWMGSVKFDTNPHGFISPTFAWTQPSGAMGGRTSESSLDLTIADAGPGNYVQGIRLGGNIGGQGIIRNSTAKVTATDSVATLSNSYTVNWHLPQEWNSSADITSAGPNKIFSQPGFYVDNGGVTHTVLEPDRNISFSIEEKTVNLNIITKNGINNASIVVSSGGGAVMLIPAAVLAPEIALPIAVGAAAVGGIGQLVAGTMPNPSPQTRYLDYGEYKAGMRHQKIVNDARAINPAAYPTDIPRTTNLPSFVNSAVAEINRIETLDSLTGTAHWNEDTFYKHATCTAVAGRYTDFEQWSGDEYGKNGFAGRCSMPVIRDELIFYVFTWTSTAPAPPPPTGGGAP